MIDLVWCRGGLDFGSGLVLVFGRRGGVFVWSYFYLCVFLFVCYFLEFYLDCFLYRKKFEVLNNKSKWEENLSDEVVIEKKFLFLFNIYNFMNIYYV